MRKHVNGFDPFSALTPKLDREDLRPEELHERPVTENVSLQEGLLIMISKLMKMTRLLSSCIRSPSDLELNDCYILAKEVHNQEKMLTKNVIESGMPTDLLKTLIRFPFRLERIGDMLESVLNCCRIKAEDGIAFGSQAHEELDTLFTALLDMMINTRNSLIEVDTLTVKDTLSQGTELEQKLVEYRLAHWDRVETGVCDYRTSSLYLDILDSIFSAKQYLDQIGTSLLELEEKVPATTGTSEKSGN